MARFRRAPVVNVLLGETIARPDRSPEERERWARAMLILFKPWRTLHDLKDVHEKWATVYDRTVFSPYATRVIANMQVERECKDARDAYDALRKAGKAKSLLPGMDNTRASKDVEDFAAALEGDVNL
ncbi:hypothetical protein B0H14DRAFT_2346654, partial [Mycena olivaceomarginata]